MKKLKVGVIFGGKSGEHEVSLQSVKSIIESLDRAQFQPVLMGIDKTGKWSFYNESNFLYSPEDIKQIKLNNSNGHMLISLGREGLFVESGSDFLSNQVDVLFPILHGTLGEDGSIQGLLNMINLPYVGSGVLGLSICMDKDIAKCLMQNAGINVANGKTYTRSERDQINYDELTNTLGDTMFVKPANQGSSIGINKVSTKDSFKKAINLAFEYDHKIIIEEAIIGREIAISLLGNESPRASLPGEILVKKELYSYESKYMNSSKSKFSIPAELPDDKIKEMQEIALKAFKMLQCKGLARIDLFLRNDGKVYVNEVNTLPSFTQTSIYPKLWEASGITYSNLITELIYLAIKEDH